MSTQHEQVRELNHAEEVINVVFPSGDQPAQFCIQAKSRSTFQRWW